MFYDSKRRRVTTDVIRDAKCGDCGGDVVARRPSGSAWHWMHKGDRPPHCRAGGESEWHLKVKSACEDAGFQVEVPFDRWRFDAASAHHHFAVVEAVHSLSPTYYDKAETLSGLGDRQLWILDDTVARVNYGVEPHRHYEWTRLAEFLKSQGATVWWSGLVIEDFCGQDTYNHPDLLASLYARFDNAPLPEVRNTLNRMIASYRRSTPDGSLQTLQAACAETVAEAVSLRDAVSSL